MDAPEAENQNDAVRTDYRQKIELRSLVMQCRHDDLETTIIQVEGMPGRGRRRRAWHSDIEACVGMQTTSSISADRAP